MAWENHRSSQIIRCRRCGGEIIWRQDCRGREWALEPYPSIGARASYLETSRGQYDIVHCHECIPEYDPTPAFEAARAAWERYAIKHAATMARSKERRERERKQEEAAMGLLTSDDLMNFGRK